MRRFDSSTSHNGRCALKGLLVRASPLKKIMSGGQTGVDRGALEAALRSGFPCGGFCPADRQAEDGPVPQRYPLTPLPGGGYPERTRENVLRSDGTVILFDGHLTNGHLTGGTRLTRICCQKTRRPLLIIDRARASEADAVAAILEFIKANGICILNVAGPRASGWPEGFDYALNVISRVLASGSDARDNHAP